MSNRELRQRISQFSLYACGYIEGRQQSSEEFKRKADEWEEQCIALIDLDERRQARERIQRQLRKEMQTDADEARFWRAETRKWQQRCHIVDGERADLQRENDELRRYATLPEKQPPIQDPQVCPNCGLEHLITERDDMCRCLACEQSWPLDIKYPRPRPAGAEPDRDLDDDEWADEYTPF
jgi:hypothetical protein